MTGHHRFHTDEQRGVAVSGQVLQQRVLVFLDRLPTPHRGVGLAAQRGGRAAHVALDGGCANAVGPRGVGAARLGRGRIGHHASGAVGVSGGHQVGVFNQGAVAVAVATVAGLDEPVEAPGAGSLAGGLLDQLLHRDRTVRAGGVVVEVTSHVLASDRGGGRRSGGDDRCGRTQHAHDGKSDLALVKALGHELLQKDGEWGETGCVPAAKQSTSPRPGRTRRRQTGLWPQTSARG